MAGSRKFNAYVALPPGGAGPGVLVLHAWWGLNGFFRELCDRLAAAGFVALAPDLYGGGRPATTIAEAQARLDAADGDAMLAAVKSGINQLADHEAVRGHGLGVIGFSMGASWALVASMMHPAEVAAVTLFYGSDMVDFGAARAAYLGHYAPGDAWEPDEGVEKMEQAMRAAGREVAVHWYPGAGHWFFEANRSENYQQEAAELAWERTLAFLRERLA
jgi:carboxymethylenebutenolidase